MGFPVLGFTSPSALNRLPAVGTPSKPCLAGRLSAVRRGQADAATGSATASRANRDGKGHAPVGASLTGDGSLRACRRPAKAGLERFWSGAAYGRGATDRKGAMKHTRRLSLLAGALGVLASTLALQAVAGPPNHVNRLEATFAETNVSVTNRVADLGVFQLINTGTGT